MNTSLVVVAAGNSSRMGGENKQFLLVDEKPVLAHTLLAFDYLSEITEIVVVTRERDILTVGDMVKEFGITKVKAIIPGGESRQESVCLGLNHVNEEKVLIHDGARPFVSEKTICDLLHALEGCDAAVPGVPVKDTVKRVNADSEIIETVERHDLYAAQTPQGFTTKMILSAHQKVQEDGVAVTDDASVAEYVGIPVKMVKGDYRNIKITTPDDILFAEAICAGR